MERLKKLIVLDNIYLFEFENKVFVILNYQMYIVMYKYDDLMF